MLSIKRIVRLRKNHTNSLKTEKIFIYLRKNHAQFFEE